MVLVKHGNCLGFMSGVLCEFWLLLFPCLFYSKYVLFRVFRISPGPALRGPELVVPATDTGVVKDTEVEDTSKDTGVIL